MESLLAYRLCALESQSQGDTSPFPPAAYQFAVDRMTSGDREFLELQTDAWIMDNLFGDPEECSIGERISEQVSDSIMIWADSK